ncbi:Putative protein [Zobellia galactanivorans]|uniref:Uncharacterized protein n=1 Tax=Zobellia galactanivorans (strain DSM 12802 / CCUG 47099 / CIP 106680 / NCIMB 13871 / Dsij) TaxID=63186 RepID=G0KZS1_ZOBGA|nr:Putative protein [Zobellia galactanivorans]
MDVLGDRAAFGSRYVFGAFDPPDVLSGGAILVLRPLIILNI